MASFTLLRSALDDRESEGKPFVTLRTLVFALKSKKEHNAIFKSTLLPSLYKKHFNLIYVKVYFLFSI